jgi:hypothetical protein
MKSLFSYKSQTKEWFWPQNEANFIFFKSIPMTQAKTTSSN